MKQIIGFSAPALVIAALLMTGAIGASAQTYSDVYGQVDANAAVKTKAVVPGAVGVDANTKTKIDASVKARNVQPQADVEIKKDSKAEYWAQFGTAEGLRGIAVGVTNNFSNSRRVLEAAHDRIFELSNKIESRLTKLPADKYDVSAQLKLLASAREELRLAKISIEASKVSFGAELEAFTENANVQYFKRLYERCKNEGYPVMETAPERCLAPNGITYVNADSAPRIGKGAVRPSFAKTRANIEEAKDHLKNAHGLLVRIIASLKPEISDNEAGNEVKQVSPSSSGGSVRVKSSTNSEVNTEPATN